MRLHNPYQNIFHYYRGSSKRKRKEVDTQLEDNLTKSLINTLEYSDRGLLKHFFQRLNINCKIGKNYPVYKLQVSKKESRPDAEIIIGKKNVMIESKIDSPLTEEQLKTYLESDVKSCLLAITPRDADKAVIVGMNDNRLRFITWKDLYLLFKDYEKKAPNEITKFIVSQFTEYVEVIGMSPFNGWGKKDFQAFLNILQEDPEKELRIRVKKKLEQYLIDLKEELKSKQLYEDLFPRVGNVGLGYQSLWGVLSKKPLNRMVQVPHFNFVINSNSFQIGVQIEGKNPTIRMKRNISANKEEFLEILRELDGFNLIIRRRWNVNNLPRVFDAERVLTIKLGRNKATKRENVTIHDVNYIVEKLNQLDLFEIYCGKSYSCDNRFWKLRCFYKLV